MSSGNYYVVFTNSRDHWWCRFLHPDYQHCYLVKAEAGRWIVYGKTTEGLDLLTLDEFSICSPNMIVVKTTVEDDGRGLFMLNTCVGHIKQALGIWNPWILTPYQLYKHLTRH
jgi:hypothetical protein